MNGPALPEHVLRPPGAITFWVIYDHPKDCPNGYVLRPQFSVRMFEGIERFGICVGRTGDTVVIASPIAWYSSDPEELRAILPPAVYPLGDPSPTILETWMDMRND